MNILGMDLGCRKTWLSNMARKLKYKQKQQRSHLNIFFLYKLSVQYNKYHVFISVSKVLQVLGQMFGNATN